MQHCQDDGDESQLLQKMRHLCQRLQSIITEMQRDNELLYIFSGLQDTPDSSKAFYYGSSHMIKHPLGIVKTCEDLGLICTVYQHWESMETLLYQDMVLREANFLMACIPLDMVFNSFWVLQSYKILESIQIMTWS
jgi:hypothetical protein